MGWIEQYLAYTAPLESPEAFHRWSAIAVLGHVLGRRTWLSRGGMYRIHPCQMMVVLVSKSAVTRRSTAIVQAAQFLPLLPEWAVYQIPSKVSPQQLLKCLERTDDAGQPLQTPDGRRVDSVGIVVADELGAFLSIEGWAEAIATHIADLNTAPPGKKHVEFRSWSADLWNPCVGMLGGITPRGLARELPKTAHTAGFFGRVLWVSAEETSRVNSLMEPVRQAREMRERLAEDLSRRWVPAQGPFRITREGKEWFDGWYKQVHYPRMQEVDVDMAQESGYIGRKPDHLLRVAMVLSKSEGDTLIIRRAHLQAAGGLLAEMERGFRTAFAELGMSPTQEYDGRMLQLLGKLAARARSTQGWVRRDRLMNAMLLYGGADRFDAAIRLAMEAGRVEARTAANYRWYRPKQRSGEHLRTAKEQPVRWDREEDDDGE